MKQLLKAILLLISCAKLISGDAITTAALCTIFTAVTKIPIGDFLNPIVGEALDLIKQNPNYAHYALAMNEGYSYLQYQFTTCAINTTSDETTAEYIYFYVFLPDGNGYKGIEGAEIYKNPSSAGIKSTDKVMVIVTSYLSYCDQSDASTLNDCDWAYESALEYQKKGYAVIIVNYAYQKGTCCDYFQLAYCHVKRIGQFIAHVIEKLNLDNSKNLTVVGYSLGGQIAGFTCCTLNLEEKTAKICVFIDPGGPAWNNPLTVLSDIPLLPSNAADLLVEQGAKKECSSESLALYANPTFFGTTNFNSAKTNVLLNSQDGFCQPGCGAECFLQMCSHEYVKCIFRVLATCGKFTDDAGTLTVEIDPDVKPMESATPYLLQTSYVCPNCTNNVCK